MSRTVPEPSPQRITDAPTALSALQAARMRRYLIQMGIRVVCFGIAVVVAVVEPGPWVWVPLIAAAVLPYTAVIGANAGRERQADPQNPLEVLAIEEAAKSGQPLGPRGPNDENVAAGAPAPDGENVATSPADPTNPAPSETSESSE